MEKRITKIYFAALCLGILYAVLAGISFHAGIYSRSGAQHVSVWDDRMEKTQEGNVYIYKTILPRENTDAKVIVYNTVHMYLEVRIDGEKVYELKPSENNMVKTTGFCWNTIVLTEADAGKKIVFYVTPAYADSRPGGNFLYGTYQETEHKILRERMLHLFLAGLIVLAGLALFIYGFFVEKYKNDNVAIIQFAIFAMMLGAWSVCETKILDLFFPCSIIIVFVSHLMLVVMPVPFVLFIRHMYHNGQSRWWSFCCYANCAVIALRILLQAAGKYDLRETLVLTHISILLSAGIIVGMSINEFLVHRITRQVRLNSICVMVILASTILELGIYRFSNTSTPLGSAGFLFYIVVMGIDNVRKSRKLMERARESGIYKKLAFTDELTGLYNRTAFQRDLEIRAETGQTDQKQKIPPTVIYMFDLNDLKKCNDTYGHEYGDQYIRLAAESLQKMFALDGKCYRIGGDEFCAIAPYVSQNEINGKLRMLEQSMKDINRSKFVVWFSIAAGYAVYTRDRDAGLEETMKRADEMMYINKQEYKEHRRKQL